MTDSTSTPIVKGVPIQELKLDLDNYRTIRQDNEAEAVQAILLTSPRKFLGLLRSLIKRGYVPSENVIVIQTGSLSYAVKEGNRRVAALKLLHGIIDVKGLNIPDDLAVRVRTIAGNDVWKDKHNLVPCAIYQPTDIEAVKEIVDQIHAKGQDASRDPWNAVARARRDKDKGKRESALTLLDKYLTYNLGTDLTENQKQRWAGDFPLTVLDEAIRKISRRLGYASAQELADAYPAVDYREGLEKVIHGIGNKTIRFKQIRESDPRKDFAVPLGIPLSSVPQGETEMPSPYEGDNKPESPQPQSPPDRIAGGNGAPGIPGRGSGETKPPKRRPVGLSDAAHVTRILTDFSPTRKGCEKVETLRREALRLSIDRTPLAFCFVLRSMFEIAAKSYSKEFGIECQRNDGMDRPLRDVLKDVVKHMTMGSNGKTDKSKWKPIHSAITELSKDEGILSINSMNQLIHHPVFTMTARDIRVAFNNVFPLLEAMS